MKYLISGINGFIGTAVRKRLENEGHECIGIKREMLKHLNRLLRLFKKEKPDFIIHLAAYGNHYNQDNERQIIETNIIGTYNMLLASKWIDYKKFYNISSSSVTLPVDTFYSASKLAGEKIVNAFKLKYNKPIVNVRPYSVYGPGEASHRFIPKVIECLKSGEEMVIDLEPSHDWVFVESFIELMLLGYTEIGTGISKTNLEIVEILEKISGKKLILKRGNNLRSYDNNSWVCPKKLPVKVSLEEGLEKTYHAYN